MFISRVWTGKHVEQEQESRLMYDVLSAVLSAFLMFRVFFNFRDVCGRTDERTAAEKEHNYRNKKKELDMRYFGTLIHTEGLN